MPPNALDNVLVNYPRVKYLLCGHIHQELDLDWNGRPLLATPSTYVQFGRIVQFHVRYHRPGWRTLELLLTVRCYRLKSSAG